MKGQKKVSPTLGKVLYGIGGLSTVAEVVFLLLFLPEFAHVHAVALLLASLFGIGLPVLLMPLCYALVNGNTAISTGRYHVTLSVSGLLTSFVFVLLLSVGKTHPVLQAFALFGLLFVFSLGMQTYRYVYFSVGLRFDQSSNARRIGNAFTLVSVSIAALAVLLLWDGTRDAVRAVAALSALVTVLCVLLAYFSTVKSMPSFIRLEPRHKRSLRENYARFLSPLQSRAVQLLAIATFLVCAGAAFAAITVPAELFGYMLGMQKGYKPSLLMIAVLVAPVGILVSHMSVRKPKSGGTAAVALSSAQLAAAAVVAVAVCTPIGKVWEATALFAFAGLSCVTLGVMFAGEERNKEYAAHLTDCTPGKFYCLRNCIATLGMAFGTALSCAVRLLSENIGGKAAAVTVCSVFSALVFAGALCARTGHANKLWRPVRKEEQANKAEENGESDVSDTAAMEDEHKEENA